MAVIRAVQTGNILECDSLTWEDTSSNRENVLRACSGKEVLGTAPGVEIQQYFFGSLNQNEFDALFGRVKTLGMRLRFYDSSIEIINFPELITMDQVSRTHRIYGNANLKTVSFPKLKNAPNGWTLDVRSNRLLSNESIEHLKTLPNLDLEHSVFYGPNNCHGKFIKTAAQIEGCTSFGTGLHILPGFSGVINTTINWIEGRLQIWRTTLSSLSFLNLTKVTKYQEYDDGSGFYEKDIIIENNPNLCTSDFVKMLKTNGVRVSMLIRNNGNRTLCPDDVDIDEQAVQYDVISSTVKYSSPSTEENERKQKEQDLLEASKTTETVFTSSAPKTTETVTTTTTTTTAPEVNSSPNHPGINCSAISNEEIKDVELIVKECEGKETLGSDATFFPSRGFSQSDFDALFGKVKTMRMAIIIKESDIVNMTMPELTFFDGSVERLSITQNLKLRTTSFPKLEGHFECILSVYGNPLLSDESAQKLKELSTNPDSSIVGFGDCYLNFHKVSAASDLDVCKTISSRLKITNDFSGTTSTVISYVDECITIVNTTIEDISFLQLTGRGTYWDKLHKSHCPNAITIENNPNLCTSDFEKMIDKLDPKPTKSIQNNKDEAVCEKERKQKEQERLEASKTTETVTTSTTAPEVNDSPNHPEMGINDQSTEEQHSELLTEENSESSLLSKAISSLSKAIYSLSNAIFSLSKG